MNKSKYKREKAIDFIKELKKKAEFEDVKTLNIIEDLLLEKKYGLVWEEHKENVEQYLNNSYPIFNEKNKLSFKNSNDESYNFLLEGDNLHSLNLLLKTHKNKIDVIYIDPPYNTENSLTYNDTRVSLNDSFRHSKWLSFMNKRLAIARELLNKDGCILMSIDDNEAYQLKLLCDEIFGEYNFVGSLSVNKAEGGGKAKYIVKGHDLVLIYAKNIEHFHPLAKPKDIRGKIIVEDGIEYWIQEDAFRREYGAYGNLHYEEILEYKDESYKKKIDEGIKQKKYMLIPKKDGRHVIGKLRRVDEDYSKFHSVLKYLNKDGVNELKSMGLDGKFDFPKPVDLLVELIKAVTFKPKDQYTILDFFAGSGTTGEAVIQANKSDNKNRKFILCTNNEVDGKQTLNFFVCQNKLDNFSSSMKLMNTSNGVL